MRRAIDWSSIVLFVVALVVASSALELLLSFRFPFVKIASPTRFDRRVGRIRPPHAEIQWTNYLDYAVTEHSNSLGFMDREPPAAKSPGVFRILALGDSFVEALQVPIQQKFHVLLESMLAERFPDRRFETVAFGHSGIGTEAEHAFYQAFGRQMDPDLVVLVFVDNDFADNSPVVLGVKYGWHPEHPAWPMYSADERSGRFRRIAPDPHFDKHFIAVGPPPPFGFALLDYLGWSRVGQVGFAAANEYWGWTAARQVGLVKARLAWLRGDVRYGPKLAGWRHPDDLDENQMFFATELPPAFDEAVRITDHIFALFAAEQRRRGFEMLIVALPACSAAPTNNGYRDVIEHGMLARIQTIADRHGLPVLDLTPAFAARGDPAAAHWKHDVHWSPTGHRWAAEAITDYIVANQDQVFARR